MSITILWLVIRLARTLCHVHIYLEGCYNINQMKYAFVSLAILAVWIGVILIVGALNNDHLLLPVTALVMTFVLFFIGFRKK